MTMSDETHTLEEVAELTGYELGRVRRAVEAGNLALTQTSGPEDEEQRVTDIELERWWNSAEHKPTDEERSDSAARG